MKSIILLSILVILVVLSIPRENEGFSPAGSINCGPGGVAAPGAVSMLQCTCPPNAYLDPTKGCVTCPHPRSTVKPGATEVSHCIPPFDNFIAPENRDCGKDAYGRDGYCFISSTECAKCDPPNCPSGYFSPPWSKKCEPCVYGNRNSWDYNNPYGNGREETLATSPPGSTRYDQCLCGGYGVIGHMTPDHVEVGPCWVFTVD
jgi:hypothetical protein